MSEGRRGDLEFGTIPRLARISAGRYPDGVAIEDGPTTLTFPGLLQRARAVAAGLIAQGVQPGERVAIWAPNMWEWVVCAIGLMGAGAVLVPLNTRYKGPEAAWILQKSGAVALLTVSGFLGHDYVAMLAGEDLPALRLTVILRGGVPEGCCSLDALCQAGGSVTEAALDARWEGVSPEDLSDILFTSGTTGRPKGAIITHDNLAGTVLPLHEAWRWSRRDVLLHALPLFHIHGLIVAQHGALYAGARTLWMPRFEPTEALALMAQSTVFMGVPTFYHRLLSLPASVRADLSGMRLLTSGSAPLSAQAHAAFAERFGQRILERYGMTEAGIVLSNPVDGERRPGAVGFALPGVSIRLVDPATGVDVAAGEVGEIRIRGPGVIPGYLNLPGQTAAAFDDGWLCSGDLARRDEDGYVHIVGRSKDLVITGGLNVYPVEVERVLLSHPAVDEVAVVGILDEEWGERVVAAVIPRPDAAADPQALIAFARQHLAPYKCPREVRLVADLPRNAMGKVQKARLRADWIA